MDMKWTCEEESQYFKEARLKGHKDDKYHYTNLSLILAISTLMFFFNPVMPANTPEAIYEIRKPYKVFYAKGS